MSSAIAISSFSQEGISTQRNADASIIFNLHRFE